MSRQEQTGHDDDHLNLPDDNQVDSDYEDLPGAGTPEDGPSPGAPNIRQGDGFPLRSLYEEPPLPFSHPTATRLMPGVPLLALITEVQDDRAVHLMSPYLYKIEVTHGRFQWTIWRRYKNFMTLHQRLRMFGASLHVPLPIKSHKTRRKTAKERPGVRTLPRFPKRPDSLVQHDQVEKRRQQLEDYLQRMLSLPLYREHHETMSFLEISPLSFIRELGMKGREGFVSKRAGGHTEAPCCRRMGNFFGSIFGNWTKTWFVVKDTFVVYLHPKDGKIRAVLLMDRGFEAKAGMLGSGIHNGLLLSNMSRDLLMKTWTRRKAHEWAEYLNQSAIKAGDFVTPNRFESFAPIRQEAHCQWFVDGSAYFRAVADVLEQAKSEIFITDWWLSPEIYMKRPVIHGDYWRLDRILQRKAAQGVRVYIMLYKELEFALGINSLYSKQALMRFHPNIKVLRHPDPIKRGTLFWSHHEKLVVIDQVVAFVGGIDLCYGRWDNYQHRLTDLGGVKLTRSRNISKLAADVVDGVDLVTEATAKLTKSISVNSSRSDTNLAPQNNSHAISDNDSELINAKSSNAKFKKLSAHVRTQQRVVRAVSRLKSFRHLPRSSSQDSLDIEPMSSLDTNENLPLRRTQSASTLEDIENGAKLWYGKDYVNFIFKDLVDVNQPFQDFVNRNVTPRMPWHDVGMVVTGNTARDVARHFIERWNFTKLDKAKRHERYPWLLPKSYDSVDHDLSHFKHSSFFHTSSCQVLRSSSSWSLGTKTTESSILRAYLDAIHSSRYYVYIENQFFVTSTKGGQSSSEASPVFNEIGEALYWRVIRAYRMKETFRVYVLLPLLPAFEGEVGTATGAAIQAITHWNLHSICKGSQSLLERLKREIPDPSEYISFYGLRTWTKELNDELITELIYVHSKLLIVDDMTTIIGSSNINDRSMVGHRDSEVCVIVNDAEVDKVQFDGQSVTSGRFSGSLRRYLFKEHLGLLNKSPAIDVSDPIADSFYKDIWKATASRNTKVYDQVFGCVPSDEVANFAQLRQRLKTKFLASTNEMKAKFMMEEDVQGHVVEFPLKFLINENLQPSAGTKEALMPSNVWT